MSEKPTLYYVETDRGCGIRAAYNMQQARASILREVGHNHVSQCRKATEEDIDYVSSMGGYIPSVY